MPGDLWVRVRAVCSYIVCLLISSFRTFTIVAPRMNSYRHTRLLDVVFILRYVLQILTCRFNCFQMCSDLCAGDGENHEFVMWGGWVVGYQLVVC